MHVETADVVAVDERNEAGSDDGPLWVGVVRAPPARFRRAVDICRPAVGLDPDLATELDRRRHDLRMRGLCEEGAHNAAWEDLDVDARYRESLERASARAVLSSLRSRERPLVLATDRRPGFRCHREVLAGVVRETADPASASVVTDSG